MARDMSDKEILKMELEQLKKEVNTPRTPVSKLAANCAETIAFVEELSPNDPLIKGVSDEKNPYKADKGGCMIT
ncbi:guanine nucleotide-binding protein G(I)/G(S)/G(O) subunit gamma-T2b isoform X1 [Brachionichthys hirsutus]|uniref:guanine nucleotide-binding protein G(I)/G(S)/G(O) subunit gamma-T2b isoform X1 n=1 Tax=Brachionichthys hirsutus TaxID=412623 RepID=UPI0036050C1B